MRMLNRNRAKIEIDRLIDSQYYLWITTHNSMRSIFMNKMCKMNTWSNWWFNCCLLDCGFMHYHLSDAFQLNKGTFHLFSMRIETASLQLFPVDPVMFSQLYKPQMNSRATMWLFVYEFKKKPVFQLIGAFFLIYFDFKSQLFHRLKNYFYEIFSISLRHQLKPIIKMKMSHWIKYSVFSYANDFDKSLCHGRHCFVLLDIWWI